MAHPLSTATPLWRKREQHDEDVRAVLRDLDCVDSQGRLRTWKGPQVMSRLEARGHSSLGFRCCRCGHGGGVANES